MKRRDRIPTESVAAQIKNTRGMLEQLNGRLTSVGRPATQVFDRVVADGALRGARSWDGLALASRASACTSNVQDADTPVPAIQSKSAEADVLRGCSKRQLERGERLEGEQSPRKYRVECKWKHRQEATDFLGE